MLIENKEMAKAVARITDLFMGADGGVGFVNFGRYLNEFQKRADGGCEDSKKILDMVFRFDKLVRRLTEGNDDGSP